MIRFLLKNINFIVEWANDLSYLDTVNIIGDTYFNREQCITIKNELALLSKQDSIDKILIDMINEGISIVIEVDSFIYLMFKDISILMRKV